MKKLLLIMLTGILVMSCSLESETKTHNNENKETRLLESRTIEEGLVPLHRYYSPSNKDTLYTIDESEIGLGVIGSKQKNGYVYNGIEAYVYKEQRNNTIPLYRYYCPIRKNSFYTTDPDELGIGVVGKFVKLGYKYKGIEAYVYSTKTDKTVPLYRYYNSNIKNHFYTIDPNELGIGELGDIVKHNYQYTGIQAYVVPFSVQFPDKKLEKKIRIYLTKQPDEIITKNDLLKIDALIFYNSQYFSEDNPSDLTGLEYCLNLTLLIIQNAYSSKKITDLSPLRGLTKLAHIDLSFNQLSDISLLSNLTNLIQLNLEVNSISNLSPLKDLNRLEKLNLKVNRISDLSPLDGLNNLKYLYLSENYNITDLTPLSDITQLRVLNLEDNSISDLSPLAGMTNLLKLNIKRNGLVIDTEDKNYQVIKNLEEVNTKVYCKDIDYYKNFKNPKTNLLSWDVNIPDPALNKIIRDILRKPDDPISEADLLRIDKIQADKKGIRTLAGLEYCKNLHSLSMTHNYIQSLDPLRGLTNLKDIILDNNRLVNLKPLEKIENIETLLIRNNSMYIDCREGYHGYSNYKIITENTTPNCYLRIYAGNKVNWKNGQ